MSAGRAGLRTSRNIDSPCGKPSGDLLYILNHLYDSECSGNEYEKKSLRRKNIGVFDDEESLSLKLLSDLEDNNGELLYK